MKRYAFVLGAMALIGCSSPSGSPENAFTGESDGKLLAGNKLSESQVASLLRTAGFPESQIGRMVCTAKYESAFYDKASNKNSNGSTDYGLFQINSIHVGKGGCTSTASSLYDTSVNTKCAKEIFDDQGNNAWYGYQKHKSECDSYKAPGGGTDIGSPTSGSSGSGSSSGSSSGSGSGSSSGSSSGSGSDDGSDDSSSSGSSGSGSSTAGSCWSATLDQEMPEYSCVNSSYDPGEYQCIDGEWYGGVSDGVGPAGACDGEY
ncbi:MAG TPA: hypothetical protein VF407_24520 [Polyangiaceae bacterium]